MDFIWRNPNIHPWHIPAQVLSAKMLEANASASDGSQGDLRVPVVHGGYTHIYPLADVRS
jgi:hypothetical protein